MTSGISASADIGARKADSGPNLRGQKSQLVAQPEKPSSGQAVGVLHGASVPVGVKSPRCFPAEPGIV